MSSPARTGQTGTAWGGRRREAYAKAACVVLARRTVCCGGEGEGEGEREERKQTEKAASLIN